MNSKAEREQIYAQSEIELAEREQALWDIALLMRRHNLSLEDIARAAGAGDGFATAPPAERKARLKSFDPFFDA